MRLLGVIYNEMPWTPFFLRHLLEYNCPIVISEGAPQVFPEHPRSHDGTLDLVRDFAAAHRDRVTLFETTPEFDRRHVEQTIWHEMLRPGELYMGTGADNYLHPETIREIRTVMEDPGNGHVYQFMPRMLNFVFNFRTVVHRPMAGLCGWWVDWWPCIYRRNEEYQLKFGNELMFNAEGACLATPHMLARGEVSEHVMLRRDLTMFHYRGVKGAMGRRVRFGVEGDQAWREHPLTAPYLGGYAGPHPKLLDKHPFRWVKDCREVPQEYSTADWRW
ncbi:MAG: hypothetical protein KQJ78_07650 [Deltaproteobacteria bacterium]|nr:hypothetical protein [Deltaproteobacteria bacterium]